MSLRSRLEKLEAEARRRDEAGAVRFRVIVPPKMSRDQWQRYARTRHADASHFTLDIDNAGVMEGAAG